MNHKWVYRLYCQEGLMLRNKKPKRHVSCQRRMERPVAAGVDESWSMDFMSDELYDGRRIQLLTIVDNFTRESLAIKVAASIKGEGVVEVLQRLMEQRRLPRTIRVDNGPEFTSKCLDQWAYVNGVDLDFSWPGKPTDNGFIEAFNGRFRQECLNENWFLSLKDAVPRQLFLPNCRRLILPVHLPCLPPLLGCIGPVAGDVKLEDDGVVHHPVDGHGVGKDALPL